MAAGGRVCPTIEMKGPGGIIRVNKDQQAIYAKKGYKATTGKRKPAKKEEEKTGSDLAPEGTPIEDMNGKQLDALAAEHEVEFPSKATVADKRDILLDALDDDDDDDDQ